MLKTVIIGAGSIGALKDSKFDNKENKENVLTHAHAVYENINTELVGIIDNNQRKSILAAKKWNTESIYSIKDLELIKPDIVIVATPQETHFEVLKEVLKYKPKLVIAEKPFCNSKKEATEIMLEYRKECIPLLINYTRRYSPIIRSFASHIRQGGLGKIYHSRILYDRGFIRDACHALDFFRFSLGEFKGGGIALHVPPIYDWSLQDPTYTANMVFENCDDVDLVAVDGRSYDVWECDFVGEKGRIRFCEHGQIVEMYDTIDEPTYGNYKTLKGEPTYSQSTLLTKALSFILQNAIEYLEYGKPLICTAKDAIAVWHIMETLLKTAYK